MDYNKIYIVTNRYSVIIGFLFLISYHVPYIILGSNVLYNIGDNLDSSIIFYKIIDTTSYFFSYSNNTFIDNWLGNSIPRNALPSSLNISSWLFFLLDPSIAYPLLRILISIIGYVGMYYFLSENILVKGEHKLFAVLISLAFAILPHKPIYGGAVVAITPLFFYSFFNLLREKRKIISFILLFILPFFTNIVMSSSFIWLTFCLCMICYFIKNKFIQLYPLIGLIVMFSGIILADIHLVLIAIIDTDFISHRVDRTINNWDLLDIISRAWHAFMTEKKAPLATIHHSILFWFMGLIFLSIKQLKKSLTKPLVFLILIYINCMLAYIIHWSVFELLKEQFEIFRKFDFSRILNLNAFYWWTLFAIIINEIVKLPIKKKNIIYPALSICILISGPLYIVRNSWGYRENVKRFIYNTNENNYLSNMMTMDQYYSPPLFNEIKNWIGEDQPKYRVGSIGLHPAVPVFNGFFTIDGHSNYYGLDYKLKFREVIESELNKFPKQLRKFDYWGNRCYLFVSELLPLWNHRSYIISKESNILINNLNYNYDKLIKLGCKYIFSTVKINIDNNPHLILQNKFEHREYPYSIYLYSLI